MGSGLKQIVIVNVKPETLWIDRGIYTHPYMHACTHISMHII